MNIDMTQMLVNPDGSPIEDGLTLSKVSFQVLWNPIRGDENTGADVKARCGQLAIKIADKEVVDLSAEEISLIKERVGRAIAHPGVVLRVNTLLDPPGPKAVEAA